MYDIGWGRCEIDIEPRGYAMNGYGMPFHQAHEVRSPLFARSLVITDSSQRSMVFVCLDMAMVTHAMRSACVTALAEEMGTSFWDDAFVLTCTHTHSSPGGCGHEALYNFVTPGFVPEHLEAVVSAVRQSVATAIEMSAPSSLGMATGRFPDEDDVAWNRSIDAFNRNPDAPTLTASQTHIALDRSMSVLNVRRDDDVTAMLSLFGVHATCIGNHLSAHDGDNKGYAAAHAERELDAISGRDGSVAIFAQATAGDVSPHYHGPGQLTRRNAVRKSGDHLYAKRNGQLQSRRALTISADSDETPVDGPIDAIVAYFDFTDIAVDAEFVGGINGAHTSDPCHGASFFAGTPIDGLGAPKPVGVAARAIGRKLREQRLARSERLTEADRSYYQRLYASQGAKDIVLESGKKLTLGVPLAKTMLPDFIDASVAELKREARSGALNKSPLVPTVLPVQLVRIGNVALACCPGEFTTTAGDRLRGQLTRQLAGSGIEHVLIVTYCNDYMGYVTTHDEYQQQAYEGGHTIFGQWTLGAFQTKFAEIANQLGRPAKKRTYDAARRPEPVPADELALRSGLAPSARKGSK